MSTKIHSRLTDELRITLTGFPFALQLDKPNNVFLTTELLKLHLSTNNLNI